MLSSNLFTYNGISSSNYGLRFLNLDTEEDKSIGGVMEYTTYQNNKSPRNTIQDVRYTTPFEFEVEIISENRLDLNIDNIYKWLLNKPNYGKLIVENNDNYYYNCIFTNASYIYVGGNDGYGIYGIKATMKCDSSFMWKDVEYEYSNAELSNVVTHNNISDVQEYTYPTLNVYTGSVGGDVILQNISEDRLLIIYNTLPNDTITISSEPKVIASYLNSNNQLLYENFNKKFPRLLNGENKLGISGDISKIKLQYKIGRLVRAN